MELYKYSSLYVSPIGEQCPLSLALILNHNYRQHILQFLRVGHLEEKEKALNANSRSRTDCVFFYEQFQYNDC